MSTFPSNSTMVLSLLILALLSGMKYGSKLDKSQLQLKFDWNKSIEILHCKDVKVDSVEYNTFQVSGFTNQNLPSNQHTIKLISAKGSHYYFRFIDVAQRRDTVVFGAVEWLTGVPDFKNVLVDLIEYDIPMKRNDGFSVITIGDEMLVKDEAKYFRRKIAAETDVNFEGSIKDVFNYPHEADYKRTLADILEKISNLQEVPVYIMMLRPDVEVDQEAVKLLVDTLSARNKTQMIIWITTSFNPNVSIPHEAHHIQEYLVNLQNEKLVILNGQTLLADAPNLYYLSDTFSLSKEGYEKLAKETIKLLR